jgi:glycogenin glucosyltransferase
MRTYSTIITTDDYLLGALTLHKSLMLTKPRYDLLVVLTKNISATCRRALDRTGIKTMTLDRDFAMGEEARATNTRSGLSQWNNTLSKLLIFELTQYEKIVFLDSDMMVLQNLDHLFELPHMSGVTADKLTDGHEHWIELNAGLVVIEPQSGLAASIMSHVSALEDEKECFGMERLVHAHYPDWPKRSELHLDQKYNVFFSSVERYVNRHGYNLNWKSPDDKTIAVVHFIGLKKPWSLSGRARLKWVLKEIARFNFVNAKVLFRYFLLSSSVRNGQTHFGNKVFSWLINLFRIRGAPVEGSRRASKCGL